MMIISTYYNAHKAEFKNPQDVTSFEYVSFNAAPSKEDTLAIKAQVDKLAADFKASTNDSLFVQINSETKTPLALPEKRVVLDPNWIPLCLMQLKVLFMVLMYQTAAIN
jgi:peptidyl-prolyl cis-trans isomerase D